MYKKKKKKPTTAKIIRVRGTEKKTKAFVYLYFDSPIREGEKEGEGIL